MVRQIIAVSGNLDGSLCTAMLSELVPSMNKNTSESWMTGLEGANMQERCQSWCKHRSSCITICFGEEMVRKTTFICEGEGLRLRFSVMISVGLILEDGID